MRKSKTIITEPADQADADGGNSRPGRIHGATITSWNGPPEVDLLALFAKPAGDATVGGGGRRIEPMDSRQLSAGTVRLSDGTQITFTTAGQFTMVETI